MTTAHDSSGNGHDGTYQGSPTDAPSLVTGSSDTAVAFHPATNDYVVGNDTIGTQTFSAFTIGCIIKPATTGAPFEPQFWGYDSTDAAQLGLYQLASGAIGLTGYGNGGGGGSFNGSTVAAAGGTSRLIGTWDGTTGKLFVNGALDGSQAWAAPIDIGVPPAFFAATEQFDTTANNEFDGVIDECFFVANHAATPTEIATIDAAWTGTGSASAAVLALSPYIFWRLGDLNPAALAYYQFTVGGSTFGAGTGDVFLDLQGIEGLGVPDAKTQDVTWNLRDGAYANPDYTQMRLITIPILIRAATEAAAMTDLTSLEAAFATSATDTTLRMSLPSWGVFSVSGRPRGVHADLTLARNGVVRALARFDCPDPTITFAP